METEVSSPCSQEPSTGPYPEPDRASPYHYLLFKYWPPIYVLGLLRNGLFTSGFLINILYTFLFSVNHATCPAHLILLDFITLIMFGDEYVMKLLIMQFCPTSCHFVSLRFKYSPQHPFLKHLQSTFDTENVIK
jgi:uncharacterized membrane protein YqaE (UPF0057 family)